MTRIGARCLTVILALIIPTLVAGQQLRGVLRGSVTDKDGGVLPGATVTVNSPKLIQKDLSATTNERGEYRFPLLDPGVYEIRVEMQGFAASVTSGVRLLVGQTLDIPVVLQLESLATTIEVQASPVVDTESTQIGTNFTQELLQNIPSQRTLASIIAFTPGATDNGDGGEATVHGASVRGSALQFDGVDVTDPVVGTQTVFFNFDNIEEVQVQTGGHLAEYGSFSSAVINTITKSGGNDFAGEGNIYYQNEDIISDNGQRFERFNITANKLIKDVDGSGQLGGPISRDHVWFFSSYRFHESDTEVPRFTDDLGNRIPANEKESQYFGKLTWQLNPSNKVVTSFNYSTLMRNHRGANSQTPPESTRDQESSTKAPNVEFTSTLSPTTYVQVRAAFPRSTLDLIPHNDEPAHSNLDTGRLEVSDGRTDLNSRSRTQLVGSLSHYRDDLAGNHDFKFGFEYESSSALRDFTASQGLFYYDTGGTVSTPTYVFTVEDPPSKEALSRLGFYAQDTWTIQDRVTLNLGVRVERNTSSFPEQELPGGGTLEAIDDVANFVDVTPRAGLTYDMAGDGKSVFRLHYSRLSDANIVQYFNGTNPNAISGELRVVCAGPLGPSFCQPGEIRSAQVLSSFGASNTVVDPDFTSPQIDEYSLGIEREVMNNLAFSVNYIDRRETNLPEDDNLREFVERVAVIPGDELIDDEGNVIETFPESTLVVFDPAPGSSDQKVITNPDGAEREFRALEFKAQKRMADRWQLLASFVMSRSAGLVGTDFGDSNSISSLFDNPTQLINAYGNLNFHRPYELKLQGTYEGPWGLTVSGDYRLASGVPYNRTVRIPITGGSPVTINAERLGSRRLKALNVLNLRLQKEFKVGSGHIDLIADTFNLFNTDVVLERRTRTVGDDQEDLFGAPLKLHAPRKLRLAARYVW